MAQIGEVIAGKYEILKEVGHGGMSVVYLAMDTHLNRNWAVKELKKTGKSKDDAIIENSLLAEANMIKRLDHPALPRIVDIIDNGSTIYIVMDFIEGQSLDKILAEFGAQPEEKVISWGMQICDVLKYLHSQKPPIIYRDMKPANLMLKPNGNICIIDFGIAREFIETKADTTVLGTRGYAPPEQYSGLTEPRSDIFALGMTMHHLLTGVDPTRGEQYEPVRYWNPELSEGIEAIIDKCVEPSLEKRYQNCSDLMLDLQEPEKVTRGWKKMLKKRLATFITVGTLTVAFAAAGIITNRIAASGKVKNYHYWIDIGDYDGAIEIDKDNIEAYTKIYDDMIRDESSTTEDFLSLRNKLNKSDLNPETDQEVAELYYDLGGMFLLDEKVSFLNRVNNALTCFDKIKDNQSFPKKDLVQAYCRIIEFLNKKTRKSAGRSKDDYEDLLNDIRSVVSVLDSLTGDDADFERATYYYTVLMTISENVTGFIGSDIKKEDLTALINETIMPRIEIIDTAQVSFLKGLIEKTVKMKNDCLKKIENEYGKVM